MSQFALVYQYDPTQTSPSEEEIPLWLAVDKEVKDAGIFVYAAGFHAAEAGRVVRMTGGETSAADGPVTESGEIVAGLYVVEAPDLDAATEWAKKIPAAGGHGTVQVRPVVEYTG